MSTKERPIFHLHLLLGRLKVSARLRPAACRATAWRAPPVASATTNGRGKKRDL